MFFTLFCLLTFCVIFHGFSSWFSKNGGLAWSFVSDREQSRCEAREDFFKIMVSSRLCKEIAFKKNHSLKNGCKSSKFYHNPPLGNDSWLRTTPEFDWANKEQMAKRTEQTTDQYSVNAHLMLWKKTEWVISDLRWSRIGRSPSNSEAREIFNFSLQATARKMHFLVTWFQKISSFFA